MIAFLLLAAATSAGASAADRSAPSGTPLVQATATVRIIQGERITAGQVPKDAIVSNTRVRDPDGAERNARLIEFP